MTALAVTAAAGFFLLGRQLTEATHNPPVATFSVDADPDGAIAGTTPQAYVR